MLILEAVKVEKSYGDRLLFRLEEALTVRSRERIGLVGVNGAGKSTLLSVLAGRIDPDMGKVRRLTDTAVIAQLEQNPTGEFSGISGGERTREKIREALNQRAGLLFADEPTSHLDMEGIEDLERILTDYAGAVVLISHDRALMDAVCTRIVEIEGGCVREYSGNYSAYRKQKEEQTARALFEYEQVEKEKARLARSAAEKFRAAGSMKEKPSRMSHKEANLGKEKAQAKQAKMERAAHAIRKRMELLEKKERPVLPEEVIFDAGLHQPLRSKIAVRFDMAEARVGDRVLFAGLTGSVVPGSRLALIGRNGAGKSTLLTMIVDGAPGIRTAESGRLGYFRQSLSGLSESRSILENVMETSIYPEATARTVLARLLFKREDAFKPVGVLSGGERVKVALAQLFLLDCNILLLDEPTNFLDLATRERLEDVLVSYPGTLLFAAHDRMTMNRVATHVLSVEDGKASIFEGNYDDYRAYRKAWESSGNRSSMDEEKMRLNNELAEVIGKLSLLSPSPRKGVPSGEKQELEEQYSRLLNELRSFK